MHNHTSTSANRAHIVRAAFAALAKEANTDDGDFAAKRWPGDVMTQTIVRAPVAPMMTSDTAAVVSQATRDFLANLSQSAASALMREAMTFELRPDASADIPFDADDTATVPWIGEGGAIPVTEGNVDAVVVGPVKKMATILAVTRELTRQPSAEQILGSILRARAARAFDAALFSDLNSTDDRCAGLLAGVDALDSGPIDGIDESLAALAAALADGGGSGRIAIVAGPATAALIELQYPDLTWPILPTRALDAGHIVAVDPSALVFATGPELDIARDGSALLHMSSVPGAIVDGGTADPVRSLWQTDGIGLRAIFDVAWAVVPGRVAHVWVV